MIDDMILYGSGLVKKYLIVLCLWLLLCVVGIINLNVNSLYASAKISRFRIVPEAHHFHPMNKNRSHVTHVKKAMYYNAIKDINHYRHKYHRKSVHINYKLNHIATIRANQLTHSFSHYNHSGELCYNLLLNSHHISYYNYGENIGSCSFDFDESGKSISHMMNSRMMYHDQRSNNGHRYNILNRHFNRIGIGVSYKYRSNTYYLVEDFLN